MDGIVEPERPQYQLEKNSSSERELRDEGKKKDRLSKHALLSDLKRRLEADGFSWVAEQADAGLGVDENLRLERLDMVVREGLCLYPSIPIMVSRECSKDETILGQFVPAGMTLVAPPWQLHRDPASWPHPEKFLPGRFASRQRESTPSAYFPFGLAPRTCVAQRLALLLLKTTLHKAVEFCKLSLCRGSQQELGVSVPAITLNATAVIKIRARPRAG